MLVYSRMLAKVWFAGKRRCDTLSINWLGLMRGYGLPGSAAEIHCDVADVHGEHRYGLPGSAAEIH